MQGLLGKEEFWTLVKYVEGLKKATSLQLIAEQTGLALPLVSEVISILSRMKTGIRLEKDGEQTYCYPPLHPVKLSLEFDLIEWLSIQAAFPYLSQDLLGHPFQPILINKLAELERTHRDYSLYNALEIDGATQMPSLLQEEQKWITEIEQAIENRILISLKLKGETGLEIFPHKLVHLEGDFVLVGEDKTDHCLVTISLNQVLEVKEFSSASFTPKYTFSEVGEFISRMREMSGNEIRLILKIGRDSHGLELNPPYHFLGNPYVTKNPQGDLIWAASVEECEGLTEWLVGLGDQVEILDPLDFKEKVETLLKNQKRAA